MVSPWIAAEEPFSSLRELEEFAAIHDELDEDLALLEDVIPAPEPESPFALLDDTFAEELEIIFVEELDCATDEDCAESDELDASTALLSPPIGIGEALLLSSPQAARNSAMADAKNVSRTFLKIILILFSVQPFFSAIVNFHKHIIITSKIATNRRNQIALIF